MVSTEYFSFWLKSNNASRTTIERGETITRALQKTLDKSNHIINKIWVGKGSEFYNTLLKFWLQDNNIDISLIHNEGKLVVPERFIRT